MSHTITIDKNKIRQRAYLITATKSRFAKDGVVSQDKYTFDLEDVDHESIAEFAGTHTGITVTETIIPSSIIELGEFLVDETDTSVILTQEDVLVGMDEQTPSPNVELSYEQAYTGLPIKTVKLSYPLAELKADIITLTRQKGRSVTDKSGISMMDKIVFSGKDATAVTISPVKADVFEICRHITALKGRILATDTLSFDNIVLTTDDATIFDKMYSRSFNELVSELAMILDSSIADTSLTITAGLIGAISAANLKGIAENFLQENCLAQYYDTIGITAEYEKHLTKSVFYLGTIKNMLSAQADADDLLKTIITDAAVKAQTALYPLSRKALGTASMYTYGATNLDLSFELKEIPISSSAIQLIYNLVRGILLNGALSKYYTMAGIADDKNEAKGELENNLATLAFVVEDRLRFLGLFNQLFEEGTTKVREKLLGYSRELTVLDFVDTEDALTLTFEKADWDMLPDMNKVVHSNVNHLSLLTAKVEEALYRYVTSGWWLLTNNELYSVDNPLYLEALNGISGLLSRSAFVQRRKSSWL